MSTPKSQRLRAEWNHPDFQWQGILEVEALANSDKVEFGETDREVPINRPIRELVV